MNEVDSQMLKKRRRIEAGLLGASVLPVIGYAIGSTYYPELTSKIMDYGMPIVLSILIGILLFKERANIRQYFSRN